MGYFCVLFSFINNLLEGVHFEEGDPQLSQSTKDFTISRCCFYTQLAAFRSKNTDLQTPTQNNGSKKGDMSTFGLMPSKLSF